MLADTAKLIVQLDLGGNFAKNLTAGKKALGSFDAQLDHTSSRAYQAGQQIGTGIKNVAKLAIVAGSALTGLFVLAAKEGQYAESVQIKYEQAIRNSGKVSQQYVQILNAQSLALSNLSGADDEAIRSTQTRLISMGLTGAQVAKLTPLILDTATRTGKDLDTITLAVGRAVQGSATSLGRLGIIIPKAEKAQKSAALTALEHAKAELAVKENLDKAQGALTKSEKAHYAQRKAALDAAIGQQKLTDATKNTTKAVSNFDTVAGILQQRFGGTVQALSGQLDVRLAVLRERLQDIREDVGIKLLPVLTRIVDVVGTKLVPAFGQFINALLPTAIEQLNKLADFLQSGNATTGITSVLRTIKDLTPAIQNAAEITGRVIKTSVDLFRSLPPEIQSLAVAGLAINKLTGGLVTNLAGGLISAVISSFKGLMNVNAAVVNVNGPVAGVGALPQVAGAAPGIGLGTAAALITASVAASAVASADYAGKHITPLQQQGLTHDEILAQQYYKGDAATQQQILKHTGTLPTKADLDSGNAKIAAAIALPTDLSASTMETLRGKFADALKTNRVFDAATVKKIIEADRKARGIKDTGPSASVTPRLRFIAGKHSDKQEVAVADALALGFERDKSPAFHPLDALKASIKALQANQSTVGKSAAKAIGLDIARLKSELVRRQKEAADKTAAAARAAGILTAGAVKDKDLSVTIPVSTYINGRQLTSQIGRYSTTQQLLNLAGNLRG